MTARDRTHASWEARPRRSPTRGRQPRSRRARAVSRRGAAHVALGGRARPGRHRPAGDLAERRGDRAHRHGVPAADVVDRRRPGGAERPQGRVDRVVDVGEVAGGRAVAVDREGAAARERLAHPAHRHVGPLAGSVDREEAQPHAAQAAGLGERGQILARPLDHPVGGDRPRGRAVLARRAAAGVPVHRRGRRPDEPRHAGIEGRADEPVGRVEVVAQARPEPVAEAAAHPGPAGEVHQPRAAAQRPPPGRPRPGRPRRGRSAARRRGGRGSPPCPPWGTGR